MSTPTGDGLSMTDVGAYIVLKLHMYVYVHAENLILPRTPASPTIATRETNVCIPRGASSLYLVCPVTAVPSVINHSV